MNYIRELLYRPRKSDRSNMARFFFADENLTQVAAELDSFDGRKDPERCACLVNRLRNCQDKLLNICNKMIEELEPGAIKRSREFRAKYPDDIMNDNLAGQLWFGAECLAAGSSIMNKESESESMRPLAKAVTKSLEKVRQLLREQCLSPQPEYTESIRENLKIFDRLFADFEFNYVRCMVHVKSATEYELHQDLIVLFSETLMHALLEDLVDQDAVDFCDPSLMFAIPRLAIVYGLLLSSADGPLNVDRPSSEFPSLFLPFKNLLRKIRELLLTLEPCEVMVLEMLLCNLEEPAKISSKLKEVEHKLEERKKTKEGMKQAEKLQAKLNGTDCITEIDAGESPLNHQIYHQKQIHETATSAYTKSRKDRKKKRKDRQKREEVDPTLDSSTSHADEKLKDESRIEENTDIKALTVTKQHKENSFSMLDNVDSIPCVCDESFISNSEVNCDTNALSFDELVQLVSPIVEGLVETAVESAVNSLATTESSIVCDTEKLSLEEKPRKRKNRSRKEVEIDCTGPDIEVRVSPQRRHRDVQQSSNHTTSPYMHQTPTSPEVVQSNETMQSLIRDYQQPDGRFSNGTYIPHVPPSSQVDNGDLIRQQMPTTASQPSVGRQTSLSSSLSGMGLPYQIPRPSMSQSISPMPYTNSSHVSPLTHYYNDPYDVSGSSSHRASLKRVDARRDKRRIPMRFQKDRRAKFKSTEDLLHRLYVCISGAADQLQSNYAGDFRSILRTVFQMNVTQDEDESPSKEKAADEIDEEEINPESLPALDQPPIPDAEGDSGTEVNVDTIHPSENSTDRDIADERINQTGRKVPSSDESNEMNGAVQSIRTSPPSVLPIDTLQYDIGTDAIQHEGIVSMYAQHLGPDSETRGAMTASLVAGAAWSETENTPVTVHRDSLGGAVYARNLDWAQQLRDVQGHDIESGNHLVRENSIMGPSTSESFSHGTVTSQNEFYQPEPTLLDIARGAQANINNENLMSPTSPESTGHPPEDGPHEISGPDAAFYEHGRTPPAWVPDEAVTSCMGCKDNFTLLRRRHHCRNCGQVYCGRCSSNSIPLPQYRLDRPVRVCNRCFLLIGHQATTDLYGSSPRTPGDYNPSSPSVGSVSPGVNDTSATEEFSTRTPSNTLDSSVTNARQNFYARNFGMVS